MYEEKYSHIVYLIRGAIFDVYNELGPGLLESVYEEALDYELKSRGLQVNRQVHVPLLYKGTELGCDLRMDMMVEEEIIIELKSVDELKKVHFKQLRTYLKLTDLQVGILVNFNTDDILHNIYDLKLN